jgi:hypothetical protein
MGPIAFVRCTKVVVDGDEAYKYRMPAACKSPPPSLLPYHFLLRATVDCNSLPSSLSMLDLSGDCSDVVDDEGYDEISLFPNQALFLLQATL